MFAVLFLNVYIESKRNSYIKRNKRCIEENELEAN